MHHAAVADEDQPGEPEAPLQIGQHRGHGRGVAVIAGEDVDRAIGQPSTMTRPTRTWRWRGLPSRL